MMTSLKSGSVTADNSTLRIAYTCRFIQLFTWLSLLVSFMASFVLSFFPLDVLDGIWDLIESVSEGFLTYSYIQFLTTASGSRLFGSVVEHWIIDPTARVGFPPKSWESFSLICYAVIYYSSK